jgi:hypothetical protein
VPKVLNFWNPQTNGGLRFCPGLYRDCLPCAVCCQVEESAIGRSLVQRGLIECGVFFEEPYRGSLGPLWVLSQEKKETKGYSHRVFCPDYWVVSSVHNVGQCNEVADHFWTESVMSGVKNKVFAMWRRPLLAGTSVLLTGNQYR